VGDVGSLSGPAWGPADTATGTYVASKRGARTKAEGQARLLQRPRGLTAALTRTQAAWLLAAVTASAVHSAHCGKRVESWTPSRRRGHASTQAGKRQF
jgi:hypothetical protein